MPKGQIPTLPQNNPSCALLANTYDVVCELSNTVNTGANGGYGAVTGGAYIDGPTWGCTVTVPFANGDLATLTSFYSVAVPLVADTAGTVTQAQLPFPGTNGWTVTGAGDNTVSYTDSTTQSSTCSGVTASPAFFYTINNVTNFWTAIFNAWCQVPTSPVMRAHVTYRMAAISPGSGLPKLVMVPMAAGRLLCGIVWLPGHLQ